MTEPATPKAGGGRERGLERDMVVRAALELLNDVGFSGLTLRKLADRLHVKAAALYWHFENKQDLVDAMADQLIITEIKNARPKSMEWRDLLAMVGRTHRAALLRYRDGAEVIAHASMRQSSMLDGMERMLQTLQVQGFDSELALASIFTIVRYALGCVFEEQADPRSREEHMAEHKKHWQSIAGEYPTITKTFSDVLGKPDKRPDHMFELGLELILDGIARRLPESS